MTLPLDVANSIVRAYDDAVSKTFAGIDPLRPTDLDVEVARHFYLTEYATALERVLSVMTRYRR